MISKKISLIIIITIVALGGLFWASRISPEGSLVEEEDEGGEVEIGSNNQAETTVKVFFLTTLTGGGPDYDCAKVEAVTRTVKTKDAVARAALLALIAGPTVEEIESGYRGAINKDTKINRLVINDGVAEVDFSPELEYGVGGSCLVTSIRAQIEETLLQFSTVESVRLSVNGQTEILQP